MPLNKNGFRITTYLYLHCTSISNHRYLKHAILQMLSFITLWSYTVSQTDASVTISLKEF